MNRKILIATSLLMASLLNPLFAGEGVFSGMVRDYAAFRFSQTDIPVHEITADVRFEYFGDMGKLTLHPVAYSSPNKSLELSLGEAYMDFYLQNTDVRIGMQKVIWGEAEGAFITDLVSPRNLRSFILADFAEIRKAVPAIKVDHYIGDYTIEAIWISHFVPFSPPAADSTWKQTASLPFPPSITATILDPTMPKSSLENSELFLSLAHFAPQLSWTLNGGYVWGDEPLVTSVTNTGLTTRDISQGYERYPFVGGSLNTPLANAVLRMEAALAVDKPMNALNMSANPPITLEKHHQVQTLIGLDWNMFGAQWSSQYLMIYTHNHHDQLISQMKSIKEFAHTLTFRIQDTFLDERLTARLFTYVELDPANALFRPSLSYNLGDGVIVEGGAELFVGDEGGTFGAYNDNSLAFLALRWYF